MHNLINFEDKSVHGLTTEEEGYATSECRSKLELLIYWDFYVSLSS